MTAYRAMEKPQNVTLSIYLLYHLDRVYIIITITKVLDTAAVHTVGKQWKTLPHSFNPGTSHINKLYSIALGFFFHVMCQSPSSRARLELITIVTH